MIEELNGYHRSKIQVLKIGGSILRSIYDFKYLAGVIARHAVMSKVVVVVSAMKGITSRLLNIALKKGDVTDLREIFEKYALALDVIGASEGLEDLTLLLEEGEKLVKFMKMSAYNPQLVDRLLSLGERMSSIVMREYLRGLGMNAVTLTGGEAGIVTDDRFGNAKPLFKECIHRIRSAMTHLIIKNIVVVAGFMGRTLDGRITTMGRGGSDLTATLIGAALNASRIRLFTDSEGILTGDPEIVSNPLILHRVSIREADTMARFNVKNFHPLTFKPLMVYEGKVIIGPPSEDEKGTLIDRIDSPPPLKVITIKDDQAILIGYGVRQYLKDILERAKPRSFNLDSYHITLTPRSRGELFDMVLDLHSMIIERVKVRVHGR